MAKKPTRELPAPPATDNPILLLRSMSTRKELAFLAEILDAHEACDVDRAAECVIGALSSTMEREIVNSMLGLVNNLAHETDHYPKSVNAMLCKAADAGFHKYAYNAANQIMAGAKTRKAYREAERYYKLAMAFEENPGMQAAAHVNYCPIVRDGLISGTPDWPAAVEIYEIAARMGLVKGMFNAGNVCSWLAGRGDKAYGERAAYWFKFALDVRASGKSTLDMETPAELEEVFEQCMVGLSACHIDSQFDGADLEEGIRWAKVVADRGNEHGRHNLGVGYMRRLATLAAKPEGSPGANWRSVLSKMDWRFEGEIVSQTLMLPSGSRKRVPMDVDKLIVEFEDGIDDAVVRDARSLFADVGRH